MKTHTLNKKSYVGDGPELHTPGKATLADWVDFLRPRQWIKNCLVFSGLLFTGEFLDVHALTLTLMTFAIFCALSSVGYMVNDTLDAERDRVHPVKCNRPIARGAIHPSAAMSAAVIIAIVALGSAAILGMRLCATAFAYLAFTLAYSLVLKHHVILDVMSITIGFLLRAVAGTVAIHVVISPWLFACVLLLALLLGFGKRRHELTILNTEACSHRPVLDSYSQAFLDQAMAMTAASAIAAYLVYAISSQTAHHHPGLVVTIPIVLYSILRYMYLVFHQGLGGRPEELFLGDIPFMVSILLWGLSVVGVFLLGPK